jgi:single-strand DNA-binding protein
VFETKEKAMGDRVTVVGTLGQEPEERATSKGGVVSFRLASNDRRRDGQGNWVDGPTSWYRVNAWGELGRNVLASVHRGQRVIVHGDLSVTEWDGGDGHKGRSVDIRAVAVGHDLTFGTSAFAKTVREQSAPAPTAAPEPPPGPPVDRSGQWGPPMVNEPVGEPAPASAPVARSADEASWVNTPF